MKPLAMLFCMWSVLISLCADEDDCCCGTVCDDPLYARALFLLNSSIRHTPFSYGEGFFPSIANGFFPPVELREDIDDTFPFEGHISWDVTTKFKWDKKSILVNDDEDGHYLQSRTQVEVPIKIIRRLDIDLTNDHQQNTFKFHKNYGAIFQAFTLLRGDIADFYEKNERFLDARIQDLSNKIPVYESGGLIERLTKKKTLVEKKKKEQLVCSEKLDFIDRKEAKAFAACTKSLDLCIANHHSPAAYVNRGLFHYLEGNSLDALELIEAALEKLKDKDFAKLQEQALTLKGQTELEAGLYADAVITLSDLIQRNPGDKGAYFERASAYFELGNFDLSIGDYLTSEVKLEPIGNEIETMAFALGLTKGVVQGGVQAGTEFIPSLLSSLQGIGHGLWAFALDPVQISKEFVQASQDCVHFIRNHTPQETLLELAPELKELIEKWDTLENEKRGEITGLIIGKYGVDIFAGAGIAKVMQSYRTLKRANNLMTLEAMAISERNRTLIKLEAGRKAQARKDILQHANLQIQLDKQGKHLVGHKNYDLVRNKSILEHPDPQKLVNEFAGKGMREMGLLPGAPGYQEIVDFGEFIGYAVGREGGKKVGTTWGKIHYAKDGVHIVPTLPRR